MFLAELSNMSNQLNHEDTLHNIDTADPSLKGSLSAWISCFVHNPSSAQQFKAAAFLANNAGKYQMMQVSSSQILGIFLAKTIEKNKTLPI